MSMILLKIAVLLISAQQCKAIADAIAHGGKINERGPFWSQSSWRNKYKNGEPKQGERFFGSSTVFVMFTDGWHLFNFLYDALKSIAIILCVWHLAKQFGIAPAKAIVSTILILVFAQTLFEQTYKALRK